MPNGEALKGLMDGLAAEHARMLTAMTELALENQRLRSKTGALPNSGSIINLEQVLIENPPSTLTSPVRGRLRSAASKCGSRTGGCLPGFPLGLENCGLGGARGGGASLSYVSSPTQAGKRQSQCVTFNETPDGTDTNSSHSKDPSSQREKAVLMRHSNSLDSSLPDDAMVAHASTTWHPDRLPALLKEWADGPLEGQEITPGCMKTNTMALQEDHGRYKSGAAVMVDEGFLRHFVLHPGSPKRIIWDILSTLMVGYDILFIPFELAGFDAPSLSVWFKRADWFTAVFWTCDISASFLTGFHHEGIVEMRPSNIARNYVRTWFLFDVLVVVLDWVFLWLGANAVLRLGKSSNRLTRVVRTMRLLRSVKLHRLLTQLVEAVKSETLKTMFNICSLAFAILLFNHYFACGWYMVGNSEHNSHSWTTRYLEDTTMLYQYTTSLHWSLTQFTPAAMEVHAQTLLERLYSIVTLFFAMITFSTFTGSITAHMTALRKLQSEPNRQQKILQDYFRDHGVSADLAHRIWSYLKVHHFNHHKEVTRSDIDVLKYLPPSIMSRLNAELYLPTFKTHPFFLHYGILNYSGLRHICDAVVAEDSFTKDEEVFEYGKPAERMLVINIGDFVYVHKEFDRLLTLSEGQWVCEPAIWMKWHHYGTLSAQTSGQVMTIPVQKFASIVSNHYKTLAFVCSYARHFRSHLLTEDSDWCWQTDIWTDVDLQGFVDAAMASVPTPRAGRRSYIDEYEEEDDRFAKE